MSFESSNWVKKYEPKNSNEFIGNSVAVNKIKKWLHDFPNSFPSYILIGSIGVGKTILSKLLLKEAGYDYIYYASKEGVFKLNTTTKKFIKDESLSAIFQNDEYVTGKMIVDKSKMKYYMNE
jgi:replication-associated recombination protein RarA